MERPYSNVIQRYAQMFLYKLTDNLCRQGILVVSEEGKALSDQFWNETMEILLLQNPEISKILDSFAQL